MIQVVNKHKHKPTQNDFYIGRGSALGNPFTGSKELGNTKAQFKASSREEAIALYRNWLNEKIAEKNQLVSAALNQIYLRAKKGPVSLVCYCKPQSCHGDVIKEVMEKIIRDKFTVIDITNDLHHFHKKYKAEARESKKWVLLIEKTGHTVIKYQVDAEDYIQKEYEALFHRSSFEGQTIYGGDPEVSGLPW